MLLNVVVVVVVVDNDDDDDDDDDDAIACRENRPERMLLSSLGSFFKMRSEFAVSSAQAIRKLVVSECCTH